MLKSKLTIYHIYHICKSYISYTYIYIYHKMSSFYWTKPLLQCLGPLSSTFVHFSREVCTLEYTLLFKTASRNSWETAQLSKMLCDNAPLTVQRFSDNNVSLKFPAELSFLNMLLSWSPFPFLDSIFFFFAMILKT